MSPHDTKCTLNPAMPVGFALGLPVNEPVSASLLKLNRMGFLSGTLKNTYLRVNISQHKIPTPASKPAFLSRSLSSPTSSPLIQRQPLFNAMTLLQVRITSYLDCSHGALPPGLSTPHPQTHAHPRENISEPDSSCSAVES